MYIQPIANNAGAYPAPQSTKAEGLFYLSEELANEVIKNNGFVLLTVEGEAVTEVTPNTEAREAWLKEEEAKTTETNNDNEASIWAELDKAYIEGVNSAYDK